MFQSAPQAAVAIEQAAAAMAVRKAGVMTSNLPVVVAALGRSEPAVSVRQVLGTSMSLPGSGRRLQGACSCRLGHLRVDPNGRQEAKVGETDQNGDAGPQVLARVRLVRLDHPAAFLLLEVGPT
jgi:hypothetical protein